MAPTFTIANRQKRHDLKGLDLESMVSSIGSEVCRNLTQKTCDWLPPSKVKQIEGLGIFSLVFVSDRKIKELNKKWRGKDSATDVISFPLDLEPDMDGLPFEVGEIYVSVDRAQEQANEYGHSIEREIAFLVTHGVLHVLGYDHKLPDEEIDMFGRQNEILEACGYSR